MKEDKCYEGIKMEEKRNDIIAQVRANKTSGQLLLTVPARSGLQPGDYVVLTKVVM